jgi:glycosyltransferase involved in cell wall biosynthesis
MNEDENVVPLIDKVRQALSGHEWEMVLVDDGSSDRTIPRILEARSRDNRIRLIQLARNYGQSTAMQAGFDHARGDVLITMDGDLQNDPEDIPALVDKLDEGFDIVAGYRVRRQDKFFTRKVPSWIANRVIAKVTGVPIRDNGCSLKAYRGELLSRMRLYSDMHRFIPALAAATAGARVAQVPVRHHARLHGDSKYGLSRIFKVLADLITIKMVRSFRTQPLVLAGLAGLVCLALGVSFGLGALLSSAGGSIVVYAGAALVWVTSGGFIIILGLIGEAVVHDQDRQQKLAPMLARELT